MEITLYSNNCPKCNILKKKLILNNIQFIENNDISEMLSLGFATSPMLVVSNQAMNFSEANTWINNREEVSQC